MSSIEWISSLESSREEIGDKAYFLNELSDLSRDLGFSIPQGFIIPRNMMNFFLEYNNIKAKIKRRLNDLEEGDYDSLRRVSNNIQEMVLNSDFPEEYEEGVKEAYEKIGLSGEVRKAGGEAVNLVGGQRESQFVAVRSSVPEDLDICESTLNVNGKNSVLDSIRKAYASLFSPEALYYYDDPLEKGLAVIVQSMIEPEKSVTLFTRNPCTGDSSEVVLEGVWGIGNSLSSGTVFPDYYLVSKDTGNLEDKNVVEKNWEYKINKASGELVKEKVPQDKKYKRVFSNDELSELVNLAISLEEKFMFERIDVSFKRGKINILDINKKNGQNVNVEEVDEEPFLKGRGASPGISTGSLNLIYDDTDQKDIEKDNIIVTLNTGKEFIPSLERISGFIAEEGSLSSDFALLARRKGVPVIVGAKKATDILTPDEVMSIDGISGQIFEEMEPKREETEVKEMGSKSETLTGVTGTDLKVKSSRYHPESEGIIVPDRMEKKDISDLAERYSPLPIWVKKPSQRKRSTEGGNFWDTENEVSDHRITAENVGYITNLDEINGLRDAQRKGVVLEDFASIMQLEDLTERLDMIAVDVSSLAKTSGRSYDHPALQNAIKKLTKISGDGCEGVILLDEVDPRVVRMAIKEGIDSITVPPEEISKARRLIAKEERRFMLEKLRDL